VNTRPNRPNPRARHDREGRERIREQSRKSVTSVPGGELPKWVREEIQRSTPKDRREPALHHLSKALEAFADERYPAALPDLRKAKELAPRSATVREILGLASYRAENWEEALRELRTFRRMTGDLLHMPMEMDCLRALHRPGEVTKTWERLQELDTSPSVSHEARVVYASFLLDEGRPREAWAVIKPGRLVASPSPGEIRRWYVAAKVALAAGDTEAARRLLAALDKQEPDFEGIDELRSSLL
jgi:tetratricopeptide (TPR) repeat protein